MENKSLLNIRKKFNDNLRGKNRFINTSYCGYEGHMI